MSWNFGNWRDSNSVRSGVNTLFSKAAPWLVLIKADKRFTCSCGEEVIRCPLCLGQRHPVSVYYTQGRLAVGDIYTADGENSPIGNVDTKDRVAHLPINAYPSEGDIILEVEWNIGFSSIARHPSPKPTRTVNAYKVLEIYYPIQTKVSWARCVLEPLSGDVEAFNEDYSASIQGGTKVTL